MIYSTDYGITLYFIKVDLGYKGHFLFLEFLLELIGNSITEVGFFLPFF